MRKIDSHQHFWTFDAERHAWIDDSMQAIQKDFLPGQLQPILQQNGIEGCITVQVEQTEAENDLMLSLAENNSFIKGIVGWIEMAADRVEERLQYYSTVKLIKGFRHILQGEADDKFMLNPNFMRGIGLLNKYNFSYDILIKPNQLPYALQFASTFPDQRFVIDHLAKPYIKEKRITGWKTDMQAIAALPNVCCKISGMVTEADWLNWRPDDFTPYLEVVFEAFGAQRVMYGSDWPVCNVAGGYNGVLTVIGNYVSRLSQDEQQAFWAKNAEDFYRL
ncbi:amidohydrolase [Mucilaginibacter sp. AK015]|uniref:amidohydrolase family protein n=1 Tax=Mucilaginibacter sp. AK015 TaxID=2723072 RepID=UPI00162105E4|nr:amidohydrolase family protein [Mucilaginibacter sp. AK015]MBB5396321.1 L-fuconolactonase [Mucilaginibacter sp. AK015]